MSAKRGNIEARAEIKQLRADARRASLIARHLRDMANKLADGERRRERAEQSRANFYTKPAKVDPGIILTPEPATDLFEGETE